MYVIKWGKGAVCAAKMIPCPPQIISRIEGIGSQVVVHLRHLVTSAIAYMVGPQNASEPLH